MQDQELNPVNGALTNIDPQPASSDLLGDILGPLAIEGPGSNVQPEQHSNAGYDGAHSAADGAAIVPVEQQTNSVQVLEFVCMGFFFFIPLLLSY